MGQKESGDVLGATSDLATRGCSRTVEDLNFPPVEGSCTGLGGAVRYRLL